MDCAHLTLFLSGDRLMIRGRNRGDRKIRRVQNSVSIQIPPHQFCRDLTITIRSRLKQTMDFEESLPSQSTFLNPGGRSAHQQYQSSSYLV
jgi:hypothetical protein